MQEEKKQPAATPGGTLPWAFAEAMKTVGVTGLDGAIALAELVKEAFKRDQYTRNDEGLRELSLVIPNGPLAGVWSVYPTPNGKDLVRDSTDVVIRFRFEPRETVAGFTSEEFAKFERQLTAGEIAVPTAQPESTD
jgi:hypothetical protein